MNKQWKDELFPLIAITIEVSSFFIKNVIIIKDISYIDKD